MEINNTILIPNDVLRCRAGESTNFTIETRTIDPSLVTVSWELDTKNEIKLLFT